MKLKTILTALVIAGCGVSAVIAADDPVKVREGLMKQIGGSMGAIAGIAKGEKPYDAEVLKTALTTISTNIKAFPDQFPAGSDANSEASPKIWENMDDFKAHAAKLGTDADTLLAQLPADQAAVGAAAGMLGKDCGACHELYRVKK
ncbi:MULTISPECIES: c-type cytochrome [unclassified Rhizobium]|uniref:c-type cytochrome n=1 Tax=unclassified Rhizobium TaxID=2613769 RepID=UPI0007155956|nr:MULTISPECIES: cytochrome c [unclassified Rhizobium]KQS96418.1 cytochrome C556 [Rhizobium sp. Leaf386]KQT06257.1 cytochrome C556 [Rhizobium sp. Leaf391]KQU09508.1 cytochrome C556 [Rhizobium sp. Leaf453]